jgi:hypothetical protein
MNKLTQPVPDDGDDFGPELSEARWTPGSRAIAMRSTSHLDQARRAFAEGLSEPWDFEEMLAEAKREFRKAARAECASPRP